MFTNINKKSTLFLFAIATLAITNTACKKIITLDLKQSAPKIIIEANLTNNLGGCEVKVSKSITFNQAVNFPKISNAVVSITDETTNQTYSLSETSPGLYTLPSLVAQIGHTYFLNVLVDNQTYTAKSTMPTNQILTTVDVLPFTSFGNTTYSFIPKYTDLAGTTNYYRFKLSVNGEPTNTINLFDDDLSDGRINTRPIFDNAIETKPNDVVDVEMQCLDKAMYFYLFSLNQNSSTTPANPETNMSANGLGYFSVHSSQTQSVVIQ